MPANKKYLTKSPWARFSRILLGTVGGYAVMISFHVLLAELFPSENVIVTAFFTGYLLWAFLLFWAFLEPKLGRLALTYIGLTLLFSLPYFIYH
jgi:hypothetical protein